MRIGSGGAGVGLLAHGTQEADTLTLITILTSVVGAPQKRHAHAEQQEESCKSESMALDDAHSCRREIQDHLYGLERESI